MNIRKAFTLVELSVVILIIGILIAGITSSSRLVRESRLTSARQLTNSSPVASFNSLNLWLETTSENGFATGSLGTYVKVAEPNDGDSVAIWYDDNPQTTTKINALQATLANQPTYKKNAINGLPALLFVNSSSQKMAADLDISYTVMPEMTVFAVFKRLGNGTKQCIIGNDNGGWDRFLCPYHESSLGRTTNGIDFITIPNLNTLDENIIVTLVLRNGVTNGSFARVNGTLQVTFTSSHSNAGEDSIGVGDIQDTTTSPTDSSFFDGYISEIVILKKAINLDDIADVEAYLGKKWKIALD